MWLHALKGRLFRIVKHVRGLPGSEVPTMAVGLNSGRHGAAMGRSREFTVTHRWLSAVFSQLRAIMANRVRCTGAGTFYHQQCVLCKWQVKYW